MEIKSKIHNNNFVEWAKDKPEVVVLSADLTSSVEVNNFRDAYPDRFFSMGVAEQNMLSFAAGLAREGYIPFVHTFAVFIYRQALNQIISSIAYSNLPVKMFGFLPGITTPGGATHQAIDDVAVMRTVPNVSIFETGDATDIESILDPVYNTKGPVYVRMLRGEVPRLFDKEDRIKFNTARTLSEGDDITLLTSGICTEEAMRAIPVLKERGLSVEHLHITTHKPFDDPAVLKALQKANKGVITMENHIVTGGLGTAVAEIMAAQGMAKKLHKIGLQDTFAHGGSRHYLMKTYGLDSLSLVKNVEDFLGRSLNISEEDLEEVRIEAVHSSAKAEAL
ncbi:MAG: transketolase [Spirochaetales bacterium]|nr:transketolase [Spirochaetales bacterium]